MSEDPKEKELENIDFGGKENTNVGESVKTDEVQTLDTPISGWLNVDREKLPYKGKLYNEDYRFQVKPITTSTIKKYSAMDENNPLSVAEGLDSVVMNHIRVLDGNRKIPTREAIYENDRFFFTMLVHTYSGAPTSLTFDYVCDSDSCGHKQDVNITPYNLIYTELSDKGGDWLNKKGGFDIETKSFGTVKYRPLNLEQSREITDYIVDKKRKDKVNIEKQFLEFAPLIYHTMPKGFTVKETYQKYLSETGDQKKLSLYKRIVELCDHKLTMEIKGTCEKCKRPFRTPISSLAGLRDIFFVHDIDEEFS